MPSRANKGEPIPYPDHTAMRWAQFVKLMAKVAEQLESQQGEQVTLQTKPARPNTDTNTEDSRRDRGGDVGDSC